MKEHKYDFFISHASEDKDYFVRRLTEELIEKGYNIWYDEMSLSVGDSLIQNISDGIKNSKYGLIILSKNFFNKKWTKKELEALITKEIITDDNLILPIWLDISINDVYDFSPLLADKLAISASPNQIGYVIAKLEQKLKLQHTTIDMIRANIEHLMHTNDDRRNKYFLDLERRIRSIFFYQQEYYNWYVSDDTFNATNPWNQILVDKKGNEFRTEYGIPIGGWTNPEPFSWNAIDRAIHLSSKWVFRSLNHKDALELYHLLEEYLDTDLYYILYGFPHSSITDKKVAEEGINGICEVGIKDPKKRVVSDKVYQKHLNDVYKSYYG